MREPSITPAGIFTWICRRVAHAGAAACRTGHALHHGAVAHLAPLRREPGSAAGGAGLGHLGLDGSLAAARGLLERDLDGMLDVLASLACGGASARTLEAEAGKAAALAGEIGIEEVAEVTESSGLAGALAGLRLVLAGEFLLALDPFPVGTELVVLGPLLGVAEHFVGFVDQLEAVSSLGVLVDVRVVLTGQAAVRGLDFLLGRGPRDTECLVVVLVLRRCHALTQ
jgi:hypothetical protein